MSKLSHDVSGKEAINKKVGYKPVRKKGSRVVLEGRDGRLIVLPLHRRLKRTLEGNYQEAGLNIEEFNRLLEGLQTALR